MIRLISQTRAALHRSSPPINQQASCRSELARFQYLHWSQRENVLRREILGWPGGGQTCPSSLPILLSPSCSSSAIHGALHSVAAPQVQDLDRALRSRPDTTLAAGMCAATRFKPLWSGQNVEGVKLIFAPFNALESPTLCAVSTFCVITLVSPTSLALWTTYKRHI